MENETWDISKQNEHIFVSLLTCFSHLQNILHILLDFLGISREGENAKGTKESNQSEREAIRHILPRVRKPISKVDQVNCLGLWKEKNKIQNPVLLLLVNIFHKKNKQRLLIQSDQSNVVFSLSQRRKYGLTKAQLCLYTKVMFYLQTS